VILVDTSVWIELEIYHQGRSRGYTIRSSTDCLIAAIALENKVPVWHRDRDVATIARYTPLRAVTQLKQVKRG
jgi:predicted nucleic acid-binding protein